MTFVTRSASSKFSRALSRRDAVRRNPVSGKSKAQRSMDSITMSKNASLLRKVKTLANTMSLLGLNALVHEQDYRYYEAAFNSSFATTQLSSLILLMEKIIRDTPRKT